MDVSSSDNSRELTDRVFSDFQTKINSYYKQIGRFLPWRQTTDPYHILVSEIMLQQTQVSRVEPKYADFIRVFPDFAALAGSDTRELLCLWQGLGYNRRALSLQRCARIVISDYGGTLPDFHAGLISLPGIGPATAGAILAFAFNRPAVFIETNIRRVFIHFFFEGKDAVKDRELLPLIEKSLDREDPRKWYYALMDYGVMLKQHGANPNRRSAHYTRQAPFENSNRRIRGVILRALIETQSLSAAELVEITGADSKRIKINLLDLKQEGFLKQHGDVFVIA